MALLTNLPTDLLRTFIAVVELGGHSQVMLRIDHLGYAMVEIPVGYVKRL